MFPLFAGYGMFAKDKTMSEYVIEMNHIRKEFPGIVANDDITLQLKKGDSYHNVSADT